MAVTGVKSVTAFLYYRYFDLFFIIKFMKKILSFFVFFIFLQQVFCNVSVKTGGDSIYYGGETTVCDFYLNGNVDFGNFCSDLQLNLFNIDNLNIYIQDDLPYTLENLKLYTAFTRNGVKFKNPFVKFLAIDFFGATSTYKNGSVLGIDLNPYVYPVFGGGFNSSFIFDFSLTGEYLFLAPELNSPTLGKSIYGEAHLGFVNLEKQLYFSNFDFDFHAGTLFGTGNFEGNLFTDFTGLTQQYILKGKIDLLSLFGGINFAYHWKFVTFEAYTGLIYFPVMDCDLELIMRTYILEKWRRKTFQESPELLKNYLVIPLAMNIKAKIPVGKMNLSADLGKSIIIPVKYGSKCNFSFDEKLIKTILLSGLSLSFKLEF